VVLALRLGGDAFQDADGWDLTGGGSDFSFGAGDAVGALLWAASLYFCSPIQVRVQLGWWLIVSRLLPRGWLARHGCYGGCAHRPAFAASMHAQCSRIQTRLLSRSLVCCHPGPSALVLRPTCVPACPAPTCPQLLLLFFGFIETERPSDWVLRRLGLAAGLDVDALDYRVPAQLQAATVALFGAGGVALAAAFQALLGDATWAVSTGEQEGGAGRCSWERAVLGWAWFGRSGVKGLRLS